MAKKPEKATEPQQKKINEMKDYELGVALNDCHNLIHQANSQIAVQQQNIMSIMAEINRRKPTDV